MIDATHHDDVAALRLTWWRSRLVDFAVHVYVVRGVLIDTGFPGVERDVLEYARERRVRGAIVTHQHEDHAGNVEALARAGLPLAIAGRTLTAVSQRHGVGLYRHFTWRAMRPLRSPFEPFSDLSLQPLHTPGHSDDHQAVWDASTRTLFAGDLFLGVKVRVAHPNEDPRRQVQSLRETIALRPARVFCAHRGLVPDGAGALAAKADWMESAIAGIDALARTGASTAEIRARVLGPRGWIHWTSAGEYSPDNFVRAVVRGAEQGGDRVTALARDGKSSPEASGPTGATTQ